MTRQIPAKDVREGDVVLAWHRDAIRRVGEVTRVELQGDDPLSPEPAGAYLWFRYSKPFSGQGPIRYDLDQIMEVQS